MFVSPEQTLLKIEQSSPQKRPRIAPIYDLDPMARLSSKFVIFGVGPTGGASGDASL